MRERWFIYLPLVNQASFVFFYFEKPRSWSIREYSGGVVRTRYAQEFPWDASDVLRAAEQKYPAERHNTNDIAWYEQQIRELNRQHTVQTPDAVLLQPSFQEDKQVDTPFPFLDLPELLALPKARKRTDLQRMLISPHSEDYVTWNMVKAIIGRADWWPRLLALAEEDGGIDLPNPEDLPTVDFWRLVRSPPDYEKSSRQRMATSGQPDLVGRSQIPDPVEGETEVDLVFEGSSYLVFVEAKLGSDMSMSTKYDPARNQIARNIDCLMEKAGTRTPHFWMFVRDRGSDRVYTQRLDKYRINPTELVDLLPHRDPARVAGIAKRGKVLLWRDLLTLLPEDEDLAEVRAELGRRVA